MGFLLAKDSLIKSSHASHQIAGQGAAAWHGKRPGLRLGVTARGEVEDGEGRREAFRGPGTGGVSPARSRRRAARGLPRPVTNSIEAPVKGDMGDKYFSPPRAPSKSLRHICPKFSRIRNTHILKEQSCARPSPPAQLLDERRGWNL